MKKRLTIAGEYLGSRHLFKAERSFLKHYFGDSLKLGSIRVGIAMLGSSWSPYGDYIGLMKHHFVDGRLEKPINLGSPNTAGVFAHEAMHVWQRQHGGNVTLSCGRDYLGCYLRYGNRERAYCYDRSEQDPASVLEIFQGCGYDSQAQLWQDYIESSICGAPVEKYSLVVSYVRGVKKGR